MGTRRNADKTVEQPKLTAAQVARIMKLHDVPYTLAEISREVGVPAEVVREVLVEAFPVDVGRWPM